SRLHGENGRGARRKSTGRCGSVRFHLLERAPRSACCHGGRGMNIRQLGELKYDIMDSLSKAVRPLTVREIRDSKTQRRNMDRTPVMTVANILVNKGILDREKGGSAWGYQPRESREEHTAHIMSEVLHSGGDRGAAMIRLIEQFSDEEMTH